MRKDSGGGGGGGWVSTVNLNVNLKQLLLLAY